MISSPNGARIVAVDRKGADKGADLAGAIKDLPGSAEALAITADVTDEAEVKDYIRARPSRAQLRTKNFEIPGSMLRIAPE
ncbi:hypothetical protein [Bradyrhizobium sp. USDA 4454]